MNYIVAIIHNNSLGRVISVSSIEEGKDVIKATAEELFNRPLTEHEYEMLESVQEVYNEDDSDNLYSISLGVVEFETNSDTIIV